MSEEKDKKDLGENKSEPDKSEASNKGGNPKAPTKEKTTENQNLTEYKGEFIFTDNAAVLKGSNFIYGVTIDDMAKELANKVAPVKRDEFIENIPEVA